MRVSTCLRIMAALLCVTALTGCPFGKSAPPEPTQDDVRDAAKGLHIVVSGSGVTPQGGMQYAYALGNVGNPSNELTLKILHKGRVVSTLATVVSSDPKVITVKRADQLSALAVGSANIEATHAGETAKIAIRVVDAAVAAKGADIPETLQYRVTKTVLWNADGPISAVYTDNYKCGSTGVADVPTVWATIVDQNNRAISAEACGNFRGLVTPRFSPSGWPGDSRGARGLIEYYEIFPGAEFTTSKSPGGCGFPINARGMPIIGSGVKPFKLHIHGTCQVVDTLDGCGQPGYPPCEPMLMPKICGAPLPGGSVPFGVRMQAITDETYC